MVSGRIVLAMTCLAVSVLCVLFSVMQWDQANRVATVVSAVSAVAAVGVGVWAALAGPSAPIRVTRAGLATATGGGRATSGVRAKPGASGIVVEKTGEAKADGDGSSATSGVDLT
jgi:hypothetical protein